MTIFHLILRELRCESRRAGSYWLRLGGAGVVMVFMSAEILRRTGNQVLPNGRAHFENLSLLLLAAIWIIVPLMTADCVSRERREGTLPLLFLTPLSPMEVALAKSAAQCFRALTMVVAVLPMLKVPVLMGGITWLDGAKTAIIALGSMLVALSFGLLASTFCKSAGMALITALFFSLCAAFTVSIAHVQIKFMLLNPKIPFTTARLPQNLNGWVVQVGSITPSHPTFFSVWRYLIWTKVQSIFTLLEGQPYDYRSAGVMSAASSPKDLLVPALTFGVGALLALIATWLTSRAIKRAWREIPPSAAQARATNFFFAPRFMLNWFSSHRRSVLGSNPVLWLGKYSTRVRVLGWALTLGAVFFEIAAVSADAALSGMGGNLIGWHFLFLVFVPIPVAALIASFLVAHARSQGMFELMLVSPLERTKMIFGVCRTAWRVCLPVCLIVLLGLLWVFGTFHQWDGDTIGGCWVVLSFFMAAPMLAFLLAVLWKSPLAAATVAILVAEGVPFIVLFNSDPEPPILFLVGALEGVLYVICLMLAYFILKKRAARYLSQG